MPDALLLLTLVGLPFLGAIAAGLLPTHARNAAAWLAGGIAAAGVALVWAGYPTVAAGGVLRHEIAWMPSLGLNLVLRMDGFAWLFAGMVSGVGALVIVYARYYMAEDDPVPRFFAFLLAFMGSMTGVVISGNLIQLAFFWELTSLFSFLLIGYWHHLAAARDGARMALTITATGGLCLFAGVLVLGHIVGSYDLDAVLASGDRIRTHPLYLPALVLILLGALTKSAQFPFHFWLPHAMAAPTPVSAYLHSATLVKAGVFLMARLWPVMAGTDAWFWIVGTAGVTTLILGAYIAIFQHDLKGLLAYSTISHLGLITLLLGLNSKLAMVAAIFHIINHATFKASLFMAAGIIDHETGTRDIRRLSGLNRFMPFTARLALVAAAAMAGVPLLNGFLSKEMFFAEALSAEGPLPFLLDVLPAAATVASAFSVAYSLRFIHGAFFGPDPVDLPLTPHEPPTWMRFPVEILVLACIIIGLLPAATVGPYLDMAAHAALGAATPDYSLAVWHGFSLPLLMSLIALVAGVSLYLMLQRHLKKGVEGAPLIGGLQGQRMFERTMVFLSWRLARTLEGLLGTRRLQPQLRLVVCVAVLAAGWTVWLRGLGPGNLIPSGIDPVLALIWAIGAACAVGAAWQAKYHRLVALILLGGTGLVTCVTFVWFSAPDLALTQLLVEVVTTILLLLGLRWLPKRLDVPGARPPEVITATRRLRDLAIAVAAGLGMAALAFGVMTRFPPEILAEHFLERSYTEGGGTNVVNVILVDFRGFDTLGEITVLGVVALTAYALLRRFRPAPDSVDVPEQQRDQSAHDIARPGRREGDTVADWLLIPSIIARLLFPVIGLVAVYLLLRGHDLPGGGFAAGLTASIALILQYMLGGTQWVEARLRVLPLRWMGLGLLLATGTGLAAWAFGRPFLTTYFSYAELPLVGTVPVTSALIFDIGVFALVVGATMLTLIALARQSVRGHRAAAPRPADELAAPLAAPSAAPVAGPAATAMGDD
ncbi:multisubunit potassium/proton antiporter, PhaA subunit /multisubunit potassium/proton antiporter, PhaB subunit [Azospirillum oryzae]|uniref:Multisubunit potassium/proton antiporter, PhaA subunit /multisubunit potassium/proton antiporter, PhaB subunit n=1 Tax=Azospirillum oryzae TaxID=286727 RepID=A0A1X7DT10_9PROT|nr:MULTISPECIES: monovalent cation/H+ antiporter subunit A [Azospirillum]PWC56448.1 cation:proton antiporter [Azospirillum sp. TSH7]PWC65321.1 cation:proton antiporter [Azospirillum sp. TSH20]SMF21220.1 multisubunit potassium/proton antiporter, PhaA subunit /multisubunit potassium/proton antiporter, PhaB subunit [Azospirillum oryzae]